MHKKQLIDDYKHSHNQLLSELEEDLTKARQKIKETEESNGLLNKRLQASLRDYEKLVTHSEQIKGEWEQKLKFVTS